MRRTLTVLGFLLLSGLPALAHEVHHTIEATSAVAVRLSYADGKPFTFEAFEAYPDGKDVPAQVGRTDDQGRAVFVPGNIKRWRVKAFSADGHGVDLRFDVPVVAATQGATTGTSDDGPNRASLLLFGFSLLLAGFGIYQLWLRTKK
jgi:nickel transport protein